MAIHQVVLLLSLAVAAPSDKGSLRIQSTPGTEVIWEGVSLDETDANGILTVTNVPPGRFNLVLKKSGFTSQKRVVEIAAGKTVTLSAPLSAGESVLPPVSRHAAAPTPKSKSQRAAELRPSGPKLSKASAEQAPPANAKKGPVPL